MKVLAVTGTRADWGLLSPVLTALRDDPRFTLEIVATGQHLGHGSDSLEAIKLENHRVDYVVDMGLTVDDSPADLARAMGAATAGVGVVLRKSEPDLLLVLGDRYEILAAVLAAIVARVPVAHMFGGDVTEGAIDDAMRHALTKLSVLHFASNAESAARIVQMGEDPSRVFNVGSTGIDRIKTLDPMTREQFFAEVGLRPRWKNFLLTFHPATLADDPVSEAQALLEALETFDDVGLIFTGSNADPGARQIDSMMQSYVATHRHRAVFYPSLGSQRYFSALAHCDIVIGNSSSGLTEAPSFSIPTVNIGARQARRPRASSVIDCLPDPESISAAIRRGLSLDCTGVSNPYGDGNSTARIVEILALQVAPKRLLRKSFKDVAYDRF